MGEHLKKYWAIYTFVVPVVIAGAIWLITIDSRTFDSPEQKVKVTEFVENSPSTKDQWAEYFRDSMNNVHAVKTRQARYEDGLKSEARRIESDSINRRNDSIVLDYVQKNADQIFQIREEIKNK